MLCQRAACQLEDVFKSTLDTACEADDDIASD